MNQPTEIERRLRLIERQVDVQAVTVDAKADKENLAELARDLAVVCIKFESLRGNIRIVLYHLAYIASLAAAIVAGVIRFGLLDQFAQLVGR